MFTEVLVRARPALPATVTSGTPPGSNPGRDAANNAESLETSRLSAFLIFRLHSTGSAAFCNEKMLLG